MRALITGVSGFVGRHLVRYLIECGDQVAGVSRAMSSTTPADLDQLFTADLRDRITVQAIIREWSPDAIYHLAAQSSARRSIVDPWETIENNLYAEICVLEACVASSVSPRVLVVGSSDEYGVPSPSEIPTHEDVPLRPINPYALSKVAQDLAGYQYFAQHGAHVVRVRPFSHTGPGHDARFVVPSFARQIAEIEAGDRAPTIRVGNLDVERDFTDVRDVVRAYRLAVLVGSPGDVYNIGRGEAVSIRSILEDVVSLSRTPLEVTVDPDLLRPSDMPRQLADVSKFKRVSGWRPLIPWQTTLADTLHYWREAVRVGRAATPPLSTPT